MGALFSIGLSLFHSRSRRYVRISRLPAGVLDAGASSLATFAVGITATQILDVQQLGGYALFFSAWLLAQQLPQQLILVPVEARAVTVPAAARSAMAKRGIFLALPFGAVAAAAVLLVFFAMPEEVRAVDALLLGTTSAVVAALYPLQEFGRRMFHLLGLHWTAGLVSTVRLLITVLALAAGLFMEVTPAAVPFGALALGDAAALSLSLILIGRRAGVAEKLSLTHLIASGRWLVLGASFGPAAGFIVSVLVSQLAGADQLGIAEAARIAAQPLLILGLGMSSVLRPEAMEAAVQANHSKARRLNTQYAAILAALGALFVGTTLLTGSLNPINILLPEGSTGLGIVRLSILGALIAGVVYLDKARLIALDRMRVLTRVEALSSAARAATAFLSGLLRAWTVPTAFLIAGLVRLVLFRAALRAHASQDAN